MLSQGRGDFTQCFDSSKLKQFSEHLNDFVYTHRFGGANCKTDHQWTNKAEEKRQTFLCSVRLSIDGFNKSRIVEETRANDKGH